MAGESRKARIPRIHRQYETLCEFMPTVKCQLDSHTPFDLLVATILSAQTTDKRVNSITPALFGTYPTAAALAVAGFEGVESTMRALGIYPVQVEQIVAVTRQFVDRLGRQERAVSDEHPA
ncbi:endonuclease III, partial [Bifidobacterium animalis]|uniref:endonuclease III n=1 Tax=Bifidobacterium animalis TaxID=28025 RepID=UPI0034D1E8C2